jgi:hypothetical protein
MIVHNCDTALIPYKAFVFRYCRQRIKVILFEEQITYSTLYRLILEVFPWILISRTLHVSATNFMSFVMVGHEFTGQTVASYPNWVLCPINPAQDPVGGLFHYTERGPTYNLKSRVSYKSNIWLHWTRFIVQSQIQVPSEVTICIGTIRSIIIHCSQLITVHAKWCPLFRISTSTA